MRGAARKWGIAALSCIAALTLASCTAETEPATQVGVSQATVWAKVTFEPNESGVYWFERSSNGGASWVRAPAHRWGPVGRRYANVRLPETLTGLAAGTNYRFRICGYVTHTNPDSSTQCMDADGKAGGGHDSFTTAQNVCSATLSPGGSLQSFLNARSNGQVACLNSGTYAPNTRIDVTRDITLRATPGARVTIKGELNIQANGVTVQDIFMRGTEDVRVIDVKASLVTLDHVDVTYDATYDREGQGIMVGGSGRRVSGVRILNSRIHNVGSRDNDAYDHAVYCENADGLRAEGNWLHDNEGGYGFHLYPNCDNAVIRFNVAHGNDHGDVIAGERRLVLRQPVRHQRLLEQHRLVPLGAQGRGVLRARQQQRGAQHQRVACQRLGLPLRVPGHHLLPAAVPERGLQGPSDRRAGGAQTAAGPVGRGDARPALVT